MSGAARLRRWAGAQRVELAQALRVVVGVGVVFASFEALGLKHGYWAVYTVVIVTQGSIGGTLGAAGERLLGTLAGAVVGALAAAVRPPTASGLFLALAVSIGLTSYLAARSPKMKVAPVTVAIMLLAQPVDASPELAALARVAEIAFGGVIGVLATVLVLPARSHDLVVERAARALRMIAELLREQAQAATAGGGLEPALAHVALRGALSAVEAAYGDAERERASRLAAHAIPAAVPRTLWRVRNDLVLVGRALQRPLPAAAAPMLGPAAADLLEAEAGFAERCAQALAAVAPVDRGDADARRAAFLAAVDEVRRSGVTRRLNFDDAGQVFGLGFTLDSLHRDLLDLADRIDEVATGRRIGRSRRAQGPAGATAA